VADCVPEGALKAISGLITRVGAETSVNVPTEFRAVAETTRYFPLSFVVGVNVVEVAPEMFVQVLIS
jgi:hypothetical protein